ncbi:hypothetical protein ANCCAN_10147 [Ancylostoma caninum]|uniref:Lipid-binding serum glycoprotein C-terminal domain-containing protein n=1 Tax=Ancylostoma caninum TaxID=29170 RepID=A0A368GLM1_ANCCA|nr:hypothetical protein ANCCAN_10147 [Ancylostoma caninum]
MVVVWIGESVPNCLLSSAHEGELIEYTATKNMPLISSYLKTSLPANNTMPVLVSSFSLHPQIVENRLTANVTAIENHFRQDFSDIGIISNTFLFLFGKMFAMTTSAMIKSITKEGVPLPVFDNITISGASEIRIFEKYIRLNADLEFR